MTTLETRRAEFNDFVWDHAQDAFQAKFDQCAHLNPAEVAHLTGLLTTDNLSDPGALANSLKGLLGSTPDLVYRLLQIAGLTRNKILQDIKAYVRSRHLDVSTSSPESLFNADLGADLGSQYLAKQLCRVFGHICKPMSPVLLEAVNQATWPGYIRQERAKRMGHEAEYRMACLFKDCGIPFAPEEKAENPLCRDILIDGMSYDLVSPSAADARLRVLATVHTANIGQYGESKDDLEIRKAVSAMRKAGDRDRITLLAFIDGVGFESNRAGLTGVLTGNRHAKWTHLGAENGPTWAGL